MHAHTGPHLAAPGQHAPARAGAPTELPLAWLLLGRYRPRRHFEPAAMDALAASIAARGVLQPLLVCPAEDAHFGNRCEPRFEIVAGERRYLAAGQAGLKHVPVLVLSLGETEALECALIENLQRESLSEIEEVEGTLRLLSARLRRSVPEVKSLLYRLDNEAKGRVTQQLLGSDAAQLVESTFTQLGRLSWPSFVASRLPLLTLPPDLLDALREGGVRPAGARALARIKDQGARQAVLAQAVAERLSDADLRRRVARALSPGPDPAADLDARLRLITATLVQGHTWHSAHCRERAAALLAELRCLLEEDVAAGRGRAPGHPS